VKSFKYCRYLLTVLKLKLHNVRFHYRVLGKSFYIYNRGNIVLSKKVSLNSYPDGTCYRTALSTYYPEAEILIGSNCNLNGTVIHCNEKVVIGNDCMFGPGTIICDNDSHKVVLDKKERNTKAASKPIIIEDNVWIGMNCLVMKGVTIGRNSIIAAGSLVVKDVEPNSLYGGHPAVLIRRLE
jgi:acetyltransferase-like isoleucine patch superfamily enzyme